MDILSGYRVKEIIHQESENKDLDDMIRYLLTILKDRNIPEHSKVDVRKQFEECMRIKQITMKPPTFVLEKE
jgi:hypothetical protein